MNKNAIFLSKFKKLVFYLLIICCCGTVMADTVNIRWGVDNQTYTTTTCTVGGDVLLPATPSKPGYVFKGWAKDVFDRGTFSNWADVPTNASGYISDYHNNNAPLKGDYCIVRVAADYSNTNITPTMNVRTNPGDNLELIITDKLTDTEYRFKHQAVWNNSPTQIGNTNFYVIYNKYMQYGWSIFSSDYMSINSVIYKPEVPYSWSNNVNVNFNIDTYTVHQGTWKFVYDGIWETDGKDGWKPDEQIVSE